EHIRTMNLSSGKKHSINETISEKKYEANKDVSMKKICVVGLGYIGLPTAIVLADAGFDVIGYDIDVDRVQKINNGDPVIQEPEVFEKLQSVLNGKQFQADIALQVADYFIIAVPTPLKADKSADVSYVIDAAQRICSVLKKGDS